MTQLSSIAMSAYTDLVRLLKDDVLSGVEGKPTLKERGDKGYWYAARRVGTDMRFLYIGEDTEETRVRIERIERIEELRATAKERQAERSRLVRLLRAEGMTPTDRLYSLCDGHCGDIQVGLYTCGDECVPTL